MTVNIKVPPLGESISEATVAKWYKKEGEAVKADELIVELETDKINLEINAEAAGVLESVTIKEGATVKVGDLLGTIKEGAAGVVSSSGKKESEAKEQKLIHAAESGPILSPASKKIAAESGIDVANISGSGKGGRITKGDLLASPTAVSVPATFVNAERIEERVPMSRLRQRIAERLKESQQTAAILTTFNEVDMSRVMALRTKYQDEFVKRFGVKLGFMSFFVKATIQALKMLPSVNAEIDGTDIIYKNYYDIGVAVGTEKGLVVPIIRNADKMSLADIEKEIISLATKAKEGKLTIENLTGGTFSITNGGTYGSLLSTPIINPPQSAILGMHNILKRAMVVDDKIEIRPMMYLALSYDHRLIDGKEAVTFLVKIKELLENPELFFLMS